MKFEIIGSKIKVFARTVITASRYAEQVSFTLDDEGLVIEAINKQKTAIFTVSFQHDFFSTLEMDSTNCQLLSRCCILVFRTPNTIDKRVRSLTFTTNEQTLKAIIEIEYQRKNTRRTLKVPYSANVQEHSVLESGSNHRLVASAKVLSSGFQHFIKAVDSVLMVVSSDAVRFENQEIGGSQAMTTSFKFYRREFEEIVVQGTAKVIYSLKSLKILLNLMEPKSSLLRISFTESGKPVFFKANHKHYKAKLVLATVMNARITEKADISMSRDYLSEFNITESTHSQNALRLPHEQQQVEHERASQTSQKAHSSLPVPSKQPLPLNSQQNSAAANLFGGNEFSNIEQTSSSYQGEIQLSNAFFEGDLEDNDENCSSESHGNSVNENHDISGDTNHEQHSLNAVCDDFPASLDPRFKFPIQDENVINNVKEIAAIVDRIPKQFHTHEERMRFLRFDASSSDDEDCEVFATGTDSESDN